VHRSVSESGDVPSLSIRDVSRVVIDIVCLHINRSTGKINAGGLPLQWELAGDDARGMDAEAHGAAAVFFRKVGTNSKVALGISNE